MQARPPQPAAAGAHGCGHYSHIAPTEGRPRGKFRPDIELGKHEQVRLQLAQEPVHGGRQIVGEIIDRIRLHLSGQGRGRGAEMGVHHLASGLKLAELEQDASGLQAFSDRGSVKPGQGARGVTVPAGPVQQPVTSVLAGQSTCPKLRAQPPEHWSQSDPEANCGAIATGCGRHVPKVGGADGEMKRVAWLGGIRLQLLRQFVFHLQPRR